MNCCIKALIAIVIVFAVVEVDQTKSTFAQQKEWSIVIHGGAGSSPDRFTKAQNAARRESLEKAIKVGMNVLKDGGSSLDAVEQTIRVMEDDSLFNAGKGAVFNSVGKHELDASIMNGKDKSCGAVAGVQTTKNPISLARLVMTDTRHVLLSGSGADQFAKQMDVELVDNDYFSTPERKKAWEKRNGIQKKELRNSRTFVEPKIPSYLGTVGCVALDKEGNLAAGTSTGGLGNKKFGRIGDSPIIGAGTYADNATCGVSCTGIGEHFIRNAVAYDVSALMKYKSLSVSDAAKTVIKKTLKPNDGGLIALDAKGNVAIQFNTKGMSSAFADSSGKLQINWGDK